MWQEWREESPCVSIIYDFRFLVTHLRGSGTEIPMSEVVHGASQEFWRPPVLPSEGSTGGVAVACVRCGTEFILGARFCHVCGDARVAKVTSGSAQAWAEWLEFFKALEFQRVQGWIGLSTASLIAFLVGAGCIVAALTVGLLYSIQNLADFQAIQLWRIEWLLAALVAFVAGILLKRSPSAEK
jgi:hypothetical protein